ncbi:HAD family hydrolase [Dankookia rubra]|uniref:HAD family hydrolase n=1 Tax=Dankookia rubra TaxID=1442381 RepID=A0A4R5QDY0_9PROT|nr:HAD family hydrolase [Dankookia rubra]TDH61043.1 HAD family hydrolase [Dankookia rubra]
MSATTEAAPRRRVDLGWRIRHRLRRAAAPRPPATEALPFAELATRLDADEAPVIAFDIFDTLLRRTVTPEHVKRLALDRLARRLALPLDAAALYALRHRIEAELCRANADRHGELEFRHDDMARALHAELRAAGTLGLPEDAAGFAAALLACEMAVEAEVLQPVPEAVAALDHLRQRGRRIAVVSDFYLPGASLRRLLAGCGIALDAVPLFVSCDRMASKRSGRLYAAVLQELGICGADLLMVGDNPHSDGVMALAAGCRSLLVDAAAQHAFYARAEAGATAPAVARQAWDAPLRERGLLLAAPSLVLFIERLYAAARRDGRRELFFLAREGQPLLRLFERYQDLLGLEGPDRIACHYLLASRRACFIASLRPLPDEDFAGLFRQYRRISLGEFLASLRIPEDAAARIAAALGTTLDRVEADFPTSGCYARLRALPAFADDFEALRRTQRDNLRTYLASFGTDPARDGLALVDVGWKGTIQDFIAAALGPAVPVLGYYLGLLAAGQPLAGKQGLLFSDAGGQSAGFRVLAENRSLFEILLCADHGSALSYDRSQDGGIVPRLEEAPEEAAYLRDQVAPVADRVLRAAEALLRARLRYAVADRHWLDFVLDRHAGLVFRPWDAAAGWLLRAKHRENFGVFRLSGFTAGAAPPLLARMRYSAGVLVRPRQALESSFWPALTLYLRSGRLLAEAYAWRQRRRAQRA